jgi:hypothetical protein
VIRFCELPVTCFHCCYNVFQQWCWFLLLQQWCRDKGDSKLL